MHVTVCMLVHMLHCVPVRTQRGDKVHRESSSGVVGGGGGGGEGWEEETSSSLQAPDGLAPEGLHPGTELPLSG